VKIAGSKFSRIVYLLSDIVILTLGGFCLFVGVSSESSILEGLGVAFGILLGGVGVAALLELTNSGSKFLSW
jgi:hypothetical protein